VDVGTKGAWKAPFRIDRALKGFQIAFSGDEKGAWKLNP